MKQDLAASATRRTELLRDVTALLLEIRAELANGELEINPPSGARPLRSAGTSVARCSNDELAAVLYRERRLRAQAFDARLFGEPAWDLLLDLFVQQARGHVVSVSSACIAADVPATTGLRWLEILLAEGLVERRVDPHDMRRRLVSLSAEGERRMQDYLRAIGTSPPG